MLLIEWNAWWRTMSGLEAEERLAEYTVGLLSDAGWQWDRESVLDVWRRLAAGATVQLDRWVVPNDSPLVGEDAFKPGALRQNAHRVWRWLRSQMGAGVS